MRRLRTLTFIGLMLGHSAIADDSKGGPKDGLKEIELPPPADREVDFIQDVLPLLQTRCVSCHGRESQESGLRLDQGRRALLRRFS